MEQVRAHLRLITIADIEPNNYNPNVLLGEKFEALKTDVAIGNYDPILVSPKIVFYGEEAVSNTHRLKASDKDRFVIIDGEWRWRAAGELGLSTIKAEVRDVELFEAKTITFKKNRQRGTLDPFKEAVLFDEEVKSGLTENQVAERYGITRSYVAGRRSLLKITDEVKQLSAHPEQALKKRVGERIRKTAEEEPSEEEHTKEEIDEYVRNEVEEVVPRGTLTTGHLKALASLSKENQEELAEQIVHHGMTVRDTEERVQRIHEDIEKSKRFEQALEKARQPTCPYCGADPKGFYYGGEDRFSCSSCYNSWDPEVTKAELKKQQAERQAELQTERGQQIKKHIANPSYIRRKETLETLQEDISKWVLQQVRQLTNIEKIEVVGSRADGEKVQISFPGSWGKGLSFNVGVKGKHDWTSWKQQFSFNMETKAYKTVDAKTKIDIHAHDMAPARRVEVHRFFDEIVHTNQDPFLTEKHMTPELFAKYGEKQPKRQTKA